MLKDAEKEIIYGALYISLNFYKFKNYVRIKNPWLYEVIYAQQDENKLISKEKIQNIIQENGIEIIKEIEIAQCELSTTEKKGNIGTLKDYVRMMIIHHNAKHTEEPEVQEIELWRPPQKKIS